MLEGHRIKIKYKKYRLLFLQYIVFDEMTFSYKLAFIYEQKLKLNRFIFDCVENIAGESFQKLWILFLVNRTKD